MGISGEAGIGIVYFRGFEYFLERHSGSLDVIELEPQTLWYEAGKKEAFGIDPLPNQFLKDLNLPILFHGVGAPIGGSMRPPFKMIRTLKDHATALRPLSFSEHLSFNSFHLNGKPVNTNFLLPPLQSEAGLKAVLKNIRHYRSLLKLPFAFETGVNYLKPLPGELEDGRFVCEVAERADCSILLDLHNVLANQKNGRQTIQQFLAQLPLERVSELHLANGFYHKGYYLDAHSGVLSTELHDISMKLVRSLPNLKAIIFEMLPEYVERVSNRDFRKQVSQMRRIWDARGSGLKAPPPKVRNEMSASHTIPLKQWEQSLGCLALQQPVANADWVEGIREDPGLNVVQELIFLFRGSALVANLQLSTRLLRLALGEEPFKNILNKFFAESSPELFPFKAALRFAAYLKGRYDIRYLDSILNYEITGIRVRSDGKSRTVAFRFNPFPVIRSLSNFEFPKEQDAAMHFRVTITPDDETSTTDLLKLEAVLHS